MTGSIEAKRDHIDLNVFIKKSPIFVLQIQFDFLSTLTRVILIQIGWSARESRHYYSWIIHAKLVKEARNLHDKCGQMLRL